MLKPVLFNFMKVFFLLKKRVPPKNPKKILFMRLGGIGDILMSTPLVKNIRNAHPNARIDYLCGDWAKIALKGNPDVDNIVSFDEQIILRRDVGKISGLCGRIRKNNYDMCFVLDKHWFFNALALCSGIPFRVGFDRFGEGFCNNIGVKYTGKKYELDYYLDLARKIGVSTKYKRMIVAKGDDAKKLAKNKVVCIIPGAAINPGQKLIAKRWPKERYAELSRKLLKRGYSIIILGAKSDSGICSEIHKNIGGKNVHNLAGIPFEKQIGVMKKCSCVVTHDSGPMHIAAAAGARLIAIFGPTDPERFAPRDAVVITKKPRNIQCYDVYGHYDKKCDMWTSRVTVEDVLRHIK
ncbi:glycosyltransferase family 9 protein [Candidatus Woesearchaeota archaeon]|nr:glycosyltransferase family 9 protein [Candidatus Woesearchaeota archaeon]